MDDSNETIQDLEASTAQPFISRHSLSQPNIPSARTVPHQIRNALPADLPIIRTYEENNELKDKLFFMRSEVTLAKNKLELARSLLHEDVQKILDEYLVLKLKEDEMDDQKAEIERAREQLLAMQKKIEDVEEAARNQTKKYEQEEEKFRSRLFDLETALREAESARGSDDTCATLTGKCIDDYKEVDPDYTISSPWFNRMNKLELDLMDEREKTAKLEDKVNELMKELEEKSNRLADAEQETRTFMQSNTTCDKLRYVEELEASLSKKDQEMAAIHKALTEYMNRVTKLEKELSHERRTRTFEASYGGKTAEELYSEVVRVNSALVELRTENRELRAKCSRMRGGDGNVSDSLIDTSNVSGGRPAAGITYDVATTGTGITFDVEAQTPASSNRQPADMSVRLAEKQRELDEVMKKFADLGASFPEGESMEDWQTDSSRLPSGNAQNASVLQEMASAIINTTADHIQELHVTQERVGMVREKVEKMFERLKSSAALFEDILEKIGSGSELAESIKRMKLAFDASLHEQADVSRFLLETEQELTNLTINFSVLEKSMGNAQLELSRRFSLSGNKSLGLFESSFMPRMSARMSWIADMAKMPVNNDNQIEELNEQHEEAMRKKDELMTKLNEDLQQVEQMYKESVEKSEEMAHQLKTAQMQNVHLEDDIEALREQLARAEKETADMVHETKALLKNIEEQRAKRIEAEEETSKAKADLGAIAKKLKDFEAEYRHQLEEELDIRETENRKQLDDLENRLHSALESEADVRDEKCRLQDAFATLEVELKVATAKAKRADVEIEELTKNLMQSTQEMDMLRQKERRTVVRNVEPVVVSDSRIQERHRDVENEKAEVVAELLRPVTEGIKKIEKIVEKMTGIKVDSQIGNMDLPSMIRAFETIVEYLDAASVKQKKVSNELRGELRAANEKLEMNLSQTNENTDPISELPETVKSKLAKKMDLHDSCNKLKYVEPIRSVLHAAMLASDEIVQKLKIVGRLDSANAIKESLASVLEELRELRSFLHDRLKSVQAVKMENLENEKQSRLVETVRQCHEELEIRGETIKQQKKNLAALKQELKSLQRNQGLESLVPRIHGELSQIHEVMNDLNPRRSNRQ